MYIVAWSEGCRSLTDLLHSENPVELVNSLFDSNATLRNQVPLLAPQRNRQILRKSASAAAGETAAGPAKRVGTDEAGHVRDASAAAVSDLDGHLPFGLEP